MKREKAIEIIDLNIRQRKPSMPPDVLDALRIALEDIKARLAVEHCIEEAAKKGYQNLEPG